ncbi:MAG: amino acid ABC transporter permease [Pseudomonadota bacterium]
MAGSGRQLIGGGGSTVAAPPLRAPRARRLAKDAAIFALIAAGLVYAAALLVGHQNYDWQWFRLERYLYIVHNGTFYPGPLLRGLVVTLQISAWAMLISAVLGLMLALMRASSLVTARALSRGYIEVVRNIPILVLLFLFYFVVAPIFGISRFWSGVLTLALYEAAFAAEVYRAGMAAVPRGQKEAAAAVGLTPWQGLRYIVVPQSLPFILPAMTNLAINLIKHSAIVSVIAIFDLTNEGRNVIAETFMVFEVWFAVAAIYLAVATLLSLFAGMIETRTKRFYRR